MRCASTVCALVVSLAACAPDRGSDRASDADAAGRSAPTMAPLPDAASHAEAEPTATPIPVASLTLLAGGDVSFGRMLGQMLLRDPNRDPFATIAPLLATADVRFVNLEGPISDQNGETQSPHNKLVFTGPPEAARALARAGIDVVSLANNHAWDYGKAGLFETMDRLAQSGVRWVGAGRDAQSARRALVVERGGLRLAFLAVTDIWNQGALSTHPARDHVAGADADTLAAAVRALRSDATVDAVAVSYHGGSEYLAVPLERTKAILRGAIDAGADVVLGHHPHVMQGVEWRKGRPIFYSLGNFLMRMHSDHAWTGMALLARVRFVRGSPASVAACPFRIHGVDAIPLTEGEARRALEQTAFDRLASISKSVGGTRIDAPDDDGCARLTPP